MIRLKSIFLLLIFLLLVSPTESSQSKIDSLKTVLDTTTDNVSRLGILNDLTKELIRNNNQEQEKYLKEYLSLAEDLEEYDLLASKSRFLIQYYIEQSKNELAQKWCDSLLAYQPYFKKESSEAHLLLKRAAISYNAEKLDAAIKDYERSGMLFLKSGDSIFAADALFFRGQAQTDSNFFLEAIKSYKEAEKLYEALGDSQYALLVGAELTSLYSTNGFVEKSITERERLIRKAIESKDFVSQAQLIGQNINAYYKLNMRDELLSSIKALQKATDSIPTPYYQRYGKIFITNYLLLDACREKNITDAKGYMATLEKLTGDTVSQYIQTDVLSAKAAYYELMGEEKTLISALETLSNIKNTNRLSAQTEARLRLASLYQKEGNYKEANVWYQANTRIKDSIYKIQKTNAFLLYQAEFEAEKRLRELNEQEAAIQRLETEKKIAATKRNAFLSIFMLIFIGIALAIYSKYKQRIKEQAYQNILLSNKVASKTEEINALLTETIQHIKSKERIAENLQKLSQEDSDITIKSVIADLNAGKSDDAKLLLVKENIEKVNFEFIKKLSAAFPELSKTDIEICSFLKIGLDRNQIAQLRNTSVEAVRKSRHRIRKKMKLEDHVKLESYISSF